METNLEHDFAKRLASALDVGTASIDQPKLDRLAKARASAMAAYSEPEPVAVLATNANMQLRQTPWFRKPMLIAPLLIAAVAIAVGTYNSLTQDDLADATGAADARMLGSETPLDALLDQDFADWVKESQQQQ